MRQISIVILFVFGFGAYGATNLPQKHEDEAYWEVVSKRAEKIVETLDIDVEEKFNRVRDRIAQQYYDLNGVHDQLDATVKTLKEEAKDEEQVKEKIEELTEKADQKLDSLHNSYLKNLAKDLKPEQIEKVKDGMTYSVFPRTYQAFQEMIPQLTEDQKKFIYQALYDAREKAMDAGSSKAKHAWFGKYKGRINNYLSKEGYDLNKESKDWHKRMEDAKKK
ncbi:DUF3826 domain-containing protein [uncultured Sunxiuqinia sp.]|uniref:DUF3826 domain-containing protein n=1 Tax=uncultured Sunxiuqinia sp. TaxID=1573825 RepID=UPI002AA814A1|nr:DUF3826 domain-containing protein [uncultured Sunxiuqinia sp.]